MGKKTIIAATILFMVAITVGAVVYFKSQFKKAMNYCFTIKAYRFTKLTLQNIKIEIDVLLKNFSEFDMQINSYSLDVFINNVFITNIHEKEETVIQPQGKSVLTLIVDFIPKQIKTSGQEIFDILIKAALDKSKVNIRVSGKLNSLFGGMIAINDYPIDITMTLAEIMSDSKSEEEKLRCKTELDKD